MEPILWIFLFLSVLDNLTKEQRRKNIQNIRSSGTKPERLIMRELKKREIYFASHAEAITGKPDIVFRRKKMAGSLLDYGVMTLKIVLISAFRLFLTNLKKKIGRIPTANKKD